MEHSVSRMIERVSGHMQLKNIGLKCTHACTLQALAYIHAHLGAHMPAHCKHIGDATMQAHRCLNIASTSD